MVYKIKLTARAKKELRRLSRTHFVAIGNVFEEIKEDPYLGKILARELTRRFSYRVGVYRIIYKINDKEKFVIIISAGHRSNIYN